MKVKFLKDHLNNKAGDVIDVDEARANYWKKTGVAEPTEEAENKEKEPVKEKKEVKPKKEKKDKAGPNAPKKK